MTDSTAARERAVILNREACRAYPDDIQLRIAFREGWRVALAAPTQAEPVGVIEVPNTFQGEHETDEQWVDRVTGAPQAEPSAGSIPEGWKITPDEEGTSVVSPSGDACYLWDLDSGTDMPGLCQREVFRQLCQDLVFGSPHAALKSAQPSAQGDAT